MALKKIKLSDGSFLTLRDGYLYRAMSAAELDQLQKSGKISSINKSGRIYYTNNPNTSAALAKDGSKFVVRVRAQNVGDVSHDPSVSTLVPSVYARKDVPIDLVQVKGNDNDFVKFVGAKGGGWIPNEKSTKGVGLNGRNPLNEKDILNLYKNAEEKLIAVIAKGDPTQRFTIYRAQQLKAIRQVIRQLDGDVRKYVDKKIPELTDAGFKDTLSKIERLGEKEFKFSFSGINKDAVNILTEKAYLNFAKSVQGLGANAADASMNRVAIQNEVISGALQGSTFSQTTSDVLNVLKSGGIESIRGANGRGRSFNALQYSNLIVRTQNVFAYNHGARNRMLGAGRRYAIFPTIRPDIDGEDICNVWERKKYIDLLNDPIPTDSTHPNCRHTIQPVSFAQLQAERPSLFASGMNYFESVAGFRPDF